MTDHTFERHAEAVEASVAAQPSAFFEQVPGRCGGRWTFIGRRIEPRLVRELIAGGVTRGEIREDYDLTDEQIEAAEKFDG